MKAHIRWKKSSHQAFPFCFEVNNQYTIGDLCNMVIEKNNSNVKNPIFLTIRMLDDNNQFINNNTMIENCLSINGHYYFEFEAII
jgi:hypothetical protein